MKEGVYLDNFDVTGSGMASNVPVATSVDNLAPLQNGSSVQVSYTVNNPTIPFDHVSLYYRMGDSVNWTKHTTADNEEGRFNTSPIAFKANGDGRYEFFTQGFDVNGYGEPWRDSADASTLIDTQAPETNLTVSGTATPSGSYGGPVSFTMSATDGGSGVNVTHYRVDTGGWTNYDGGAVNVTGDGAHRISYYSTDGAGNAESIKECNLTIVTSTGSVSSPSWAILGGVSLIALVAGVVIYRRHRR
jgi:LPXTG-motif cell wall-anchored protein